MSEKALEVVHKEVGRLVADDCSFGSYATSIVKRLQEAGLLREQEEDYKQAMEGYVERIAEFQHAENERVLNAQKDSITEHYAIAAMNGMLAHRKRYRPRPEDAGLKWHYAMAREAFDIAEAMQFESTLRKMKSIAEEDTP